MQDKFPTIRILIATLVILLIIGISIPDATAFDYMVAKGDTVEYIEQLEYGNQSASIWMFSITDKRLDIDAKVSNNKLFVNFTENQTQNMTIGKYTMQIQLYGNNTIKENFVSSGDDCKDWFNKGKNIYNNTVCLNSPWKLQPTIDITVMDPRYVEDYLINNKNSDDIFIERNFQVEDPMIYVTDITEYWEDNATEINGYTNVHPGSQLKFIIDKYQHPLAVEREANTYYTVAIDEGQRQYRSFHIMLPIYYANMAVGEHFIYASTQFGEETVIPFEVGEMWENEPRRNETIRYLAGSTHKEINQTPQAPIIVTERVIETEYVDRVKTPVPTPTYINALDGDPEIDIIAIIRGILGWN